jgi:DNA-binding beta-propeller fold protein YncE
VPLPAHAPHLVVLDSTRRIAFVTDIAEGHVFRVDLSRRAVTHRATFGRGTEGLALLSRRGELWVANRFTGRVHVLDAGTLQGKDSIAGGGGPIRLAADSAGTVVVASNITGSAVAIYDAIGRRLRATVSLAPDPSVPRRQRLAEFGVTAAPIGIVVAPRGDIAYVALGANDAVWTIDVTRGVVASTFRSAAYPDGMVLLPARH